MTGQSGFPGAYWSLAIGELTNALATTPEGLSTSEALRRIETYGPNRLQTKTQATPLLLFLSQLKSPILLILVFATLISGVLQDWANAIIILVIILSSALLSFVQEFNADHAAEKLRQQIRIECTALRNRQPTSVHAEAIVPGDIVMLAAGSLVPGDGVVIEAKDFFVNQAVLTGETFPVEKRAGQVGVHANLSERTNSVFMGTNVRSGSAKVLIVETGNRTVFGQIAKRLALRSPETEFERGVRRLGYLLSEVMFVLVLSIFAFNVLFHKPVLDSLLFSVALAVGLTPQLLPAVININLSKGSLTMAKGGVIVRRLAAIENFGSMDVLCTDKTGTLTQGVVQLDGALDASGKASRHVYRCAYINAALQTGLANPLDAAILAKGKPDLPGVWKVDEIPYDFIRKRLSVIVLDGGQTTLITKGALGLLLSVCRWVVQDERVLELDENQKAQIYALYESWSEQGYRVLGVAKKNVTRQTDGFNINDENGLEFLGFLKFFDPPKSGVSETVSALKKLGVELKIITGDNPLVARHIAQAVGMDAVRVLTGKQLDELHEEALWQEAGRTTIFADVDPNQKERIIIALKKMGHVVGYLGDGVNDAPALHSADVGISVDNAVDVAKEAADFILLEQDLGVLREGIIQGRKTFANTLKYVFMATSANFGNMFSVAGASLFLTYLPMLPKQIMLINFLTDLPEMTIAGDSVDEAFVKRPRRWDIAIIRSFMMVFGTLSSLFDFATFGVLLLLMRDGPELFHTGWFIESVLSAGFVVFAIRTRLPFQHSHPSRPMLAVTALVVLVTLMLPYMPLGTKLGFKPLPAFILFSILIIVAIYFFSAEILKRWFYRKFYE